MFALPMRVLETLYRTVCQYITLGIWVSLVIYLPYKGLIMTGWARTTCINRNLLSFWHYATTLSRAGAILSTIIYSVYPYTTTIPIVDYQALFQPLTSLNQPILTKSNRYIFVGKYKVADIELLCLWSYFNFISLKISAPFIFFH